VVTSSTANLLATATSLTIDGFGFDSTAANDTVSFSGGVTGTVTNATATTLTVTSLSGLTGGTLSASVSVNGVSSGQAVQVATVVPVVTTSTANLLATATSMTIDGFGFDGVTPGNNVVSFSGGVTGTVTSATATTLTVTSLTGLTGGTLSASVAVSTSSSGTAVQVATVVPVVTSSTANLLATATSITIDGFGFDTTPAHNTVSFSGGVTGTVTGATATQLTVTSLTGLTGGTLSASVSVNGVSSSQVQVATVVPVVTSSTANLLATATSMTINGFGFDDVTPGNNVVSFSGGVTGTVTGATATTLTVTSLTGLTGGTLSASVSVNSVSSGTAVQVATVVPVVTSSTGNLLATATSLTIDGFGFDSTAANNTVSFSGGVTGTVTGATATTLTVTSLTGLTGGSLSASVSVNGVSSSPAVQVATVVPVVTSNTAPVPDSATTLTINGFGFDPTPANNTVSFSGGVTGTVTAATPTQLTVGNLSALPLGNLFASVSVNSVSSGQAVQVATILPSVQFTLASQSVQENAGTFTLTVRLSTASGSPISVPFTLGGTAVNGANYSGVTASPLAIPAGKTTATITGTLIDDHQFSTPNRTLVVTLGAPGNALLGSVVTETLTIVESTLPSITLTGVAVVGFESPGLVNMPVAVFTQPDPTLPASAFTALIFWGDGTNPTLGQVTLAGGVYTVLGTHSYADEGVYEISVVVNGGGSVASARTAARIFEPLLPDGTRGTPQQRYVSEIFHDLGLGLVTNAPRNPDDLATLSRHVGSFQSRLKMVRALLKRHPGVLKHFHARTVQDLVKLLYQKLLDRQPDAEGLKAWVKWLQSGKSLAEAMAIMLASTEFYRKTIL
jgi:hypothetical protein